MKAPTLAEKLHLPERQSPLLTKAKSLDLHSAAELEALAVSRGCWHYRQPEMIAPPRVAESRFSNEELAVALLSPCLPYSPHCIRLGAAMLGAEGTSVSRLVSLAAEESCEGIVRYVAQAALGFEPDNPHWHELLEKLPKSRPPADGVLPHPTRFVSMTGITRAGPGKVAVWIRPRAELAFAHG